MNEQRRRLAEVSTSSAPLIASLHRRLCRDTGFAARLKREVGTRPSATRIAVEWHSFLQSAPKDMRNGMNADISFLVAALYALDGRAFRGGNVAMAIEANGEQGGTQEAVTPTSRVGNLGDTLKSMVSRKIEEDAMTRRLTRLLNSTLDEDCGGTLPWRLRQVVALARSKQAAINWPMLHHDLLRWNDSKRRVQHSWARDFVAQSGSPEKADEALDAVDINEGDNT